MANIEHRKDCLGDIKTVACAGCVEAAIECCKEAVEIMFVNLIDHDVKIGRKQMKKIRKAMETLGMI
jgi:hypothetical protein